MSFRLGPQHLDRLPAEAVADPPTFVIELSERDAAALGASETTITNDGGDSTFLSLKTKFMQEDDGPNDLGPCLADEVVATHVETGEQFVVIEAGHCILVEWRYYIDDAYNYLED